MTAYDMRICDWISDVCSSDLVDIHWATQRHAACVDAQYFPPPAFIRHADDDLTIKTTGAAERFINCFGPVRRSDDDQIGACLQTVHQRQQLAANPLFGQMEKPHDGPQFPKPHPEGGLLLEKKKKHTIQPIRTVLLYSN